jgi:L-histidine Nalpha-methyltransferase
MPNLARTQSPNPRMLAEVAAGLAAPQKELSPKFFYDQRGSELFEEITRLPEYYPTRTERALLESWMPELMAQLGTRTLVELGAGNAEKSRIILDAMRATGLAELYVPIDVSATFLSQTAGQLRREYPGLTVEPAIADIAVELNLPRRIPHPALFAFLGSTIGNFYPPAAIRLLARVRAAMEPGDRFLLGVDLRKDLARVEAAYNDSRGVTAAFNRNMLAVMNRELDADFDLDAFEHVAFYDREQQWIEMRLRALRPMVVNVRKLDLGVHFANREELRTEISAKFTRERLEADLAAAGLRSRAFLTDPEGLFALSVAAPAR